MAKGNIKFCVQAGNLVFETEGTEAFVVEQISQHRDYIQKILREQLKLIRGGRVSLAKAVPARRGRPPKKLVAGQAKKSRRRPGRQPVIIRDSSLKLKPRQLSGLQKHMKKMAGDAQLSKDAAVFGIAHYLCTEILKIDTFTAGDVMAAYVQLGKLPNAPAYRSVDVVQMLRNLAATSIGKIWVTRNDNGTFTLTAKGKKVGQAGNIVRPRGRRPGSTKKAIKARRGRKKAARK